MAKNIFRTAYDRVIEARELQARRYVNGALLSFDDETLKTLGRRREDVIREGTSSLPF